MKQHYNIEIEFDTEDNIHKGWLRDFFKSQLRDILEADDVSIRYVKVKIKKLPQWKLMLNR